MKEYTFRVGLVKEGEADARYYINYLFETMGFYSFTIRKVAGVWNCSTEDSLEIVLVWPELTTTRLAGIMESLKANLFQEEILVTVADVAVIRG